MFNKLEWKSAGPIMQQSLKQVPLPATALIASVLSQISNQTNIGLAGIQMRCCTGSLKIAQVNPNKLPPLVDPGKKNILYPNEIEEGE